MRLLVICVLLWVNVVFGCEPFAPIKQPNGNYSVGFRCSSNTVGPNPDCCVFQVRNEHGPVTKRLCCPPPAQIVDIEYVGDQPEQVKTVSATVFFTRNPNLFNQPETLADYLKSVGSPFQPHSGKERMHLMTKQLEIEQGWEDAQMELMSASTNPCGGSGGGSDSGGGSSDNPHGQPVFDPNEGRKCVPDVTNCQDTYYCQTYLQNPANTQAGCINQYQAMFGAGGSEADALAACAPCPDICTRKQFGTASPITQSCYLGQNFCTQDMSEAARFKPPLTTSYKYEPTLKMWYFIDDSYRVQQNEAQYIQIQARLKSLSSDLNTINAGVSAFGQFMNSTLQFEKVENDDWRSQASIDTDWKDFTGNVLAQQKTLAKNAQTTLSDIKTLSSTTQQEFQQQNGDLQTLYSSALDAFGKDTRELVLVRQLLNYSQTQLNLIAQRTIDIKHQTLLLADGQRDNLAAFTEVKRNRGPQRTLIQLFFSMLDQVTSDGMVPFLPPSTIPGQTYGSKPQVTINTVRYTAFEKIDIWWGSIDILNKPVVNHATALVTCDNVQLLNNTYSWFSTRDALNILGSPNSIPCPGDPTKECLCQPYPAPAGVPVTCQCWIQITGQLCTMTDSNPANNDVRGSTYVNSAGQTVAWDTTIGLNDMHGCQSINVSPYTQTNGLATTLLNMTYWQNWQTNLCESPIQAPGESMYVIHSSNRQKLWTFPRDATLCNTDYQQMLQQSGEFGLTFPYVIDQIWSVAFMFFNSKRNLIERQIFGALPFQGLVWDDIPFQDSAVFNETSAGRMFTFISTGPFTQPIYHLTPRAGPKGIVKTFTVETQRPDGTWVEDKQAIKDIWMSTDMPQVISKRMVFTGYLEAIRSGGQDPRLVSGYGGQQSQIFGRYMLDIPQERSCSALKPMACKNTANYMQVPPLNSTSRPNIHNKRRMFDPNFWHLANGMDPATEWAFDVNAATMNPATYYTNVLRPVGGSQYYFASTQRTGNGEIATDMDHFGWNLTLFGGAQTADELPYFYKVYRQWSMQGSIVFSSDQLILEQPASKCLPPSSFAVSNEIDGQLFVTINNTFPNNIGLILHTVDPLGKDPLCNRDYIFDLDPFNVTAPLPFLIPKCSATAVRLSVTTTDHSEQCWSWNATNYQVTIQPGRQERRLTTWQRQDMNALYMQNVAALFGQIYTNTITLFQGAVEQFQAMNSDLSVEQRERAFEEVANATLVAFYAAHSNFSRILAQRANSSWAQGQQLQLYITQAQNDMSQSFNSIFARFAALPNPNTVINDINQQNALADNLTIEGQRDLQQFTVYAQNFSGILKITDPLTGLNWTNWGPNAWKCTISFAQLIQQFPGVPPGKLINTVIANRRATLEARQRDDCAVVGFLSMFNFLCGNWDMLRIFFCILFAVLPVILLMFLLPGLGHNIFAGAYAIEPGCKDCCRDRGLDRRNRERAAKASATDEEHISETTPMVTATTQLNLSVSGHPTFVPISRWPDRRTYGFSAREENL